TAGLRLDAAMVAGDGCQDEAVTQELQHLDGVAHDVTGEADLLRLRQRRAPGVPAALGGETLDVIPEPGDQDLLGSAVALDLVGREVDGPEGVLHRLEDVATGAD